MTSPPIIRCTTHLEDASRIPHFFSGSEARGRLPLTDTSPLTPSDPPPTPSQWRPAVRHGRCGAR
eukprot:2737943-Pyramimonas_sp.AAC.2